MGEEPQARDVGQEQDLELVRRVQAGERSAFDLLVRKYQHRVAAIIHKKLMEPPGAATLGW